MIFAFHTTEQLFYEKQFEESNIRILLVPMVTLIIVLIVPSVIYGLESNVSSASLNISPLASVSSTNPKPILLYPNPSLIDKSGNLKNNITQAANIKDIRNGTVADGISKLLILVPHISKLQFSIKD
jgi:ABC-type lipoprotein release transport system permease subunit